MLSWCSQYSDIMMLNTCRIRRLSFDGVGELECFHAGREYVLGRRLKVDDTLFQKYEG